MDEEILGFLDQGITFNDDWVRRLGPAHFGHINFRGTFRFGIEQYLEALDDGGTAEVKLVSS
jgi:hypothetical protein